MPEAFQFVATFCAALFAGAALYINVAEHPARMVLDTRAAATQWAPSYRRATLLQAPLALTSLVTGIVAWIMGAGLWWLIAALLIGSVVPFTFLVVLPVNQKLLDPTRDLSTAETRSLLVKWNRLHAVRTLVSLIAAALYLAA